MLSGSKEVLVWNVVPIPSKGRKWNPRTALQGAEETVMAQFGRGAVMPWCRGAGRAV